MDKSEIEQWLKKYNITTYTIHPNLVVDVNGDVIISSVNLESFPFQFGKVSGHFYCSHNPELNSLQGCPTTVTRDFDCSDNPKLTSLQYCPTTTGNFYCSNNELLTSLQYCPTTATGHFDCSNNKLLTSLQYGPLTVGGNFNCSHNDLTSLQYGPSTVTGNFDCSDNNLTSLQYGPTTVTGRFFGSNNAFEVTRENEGLWIRAIKAHKGVYKCIKEKATPHMTAVYELRWER